MVEMVALLAATALTLAYRFPVDVPRIYDVRVAFDGFIPVLGGQTGKVEVDLAVEAKGLAPDPAGNPRVISDLKELSLIFNGAKMPFNADNVKDYFPATTISMTPLGATLKTDAPSLDLPVKLPGLDVKRFPDITYIPLELPAEGVEVGKGYSFSKAFGDSVVSYTVTPRTVTEQAVEMDVKLAQSYDVLENEALEVVTNPKDAINSVHTDVTGAGRATFDRKEGVFSQVEVDASALSKVTDLESKKVSKRDLKTKLTIKLRPSTP